MNRSNGNNQIRGLMQGRRSRLPRTAGMLHLPALALLFSLFLIACTSAPKEEPVTNLYDIEVKTITGETIRMEEYRGHTLLIVNTASRCGFTGQYDGLQKLYETYRDRGFVVLGFPSNDFLRQEPGTNEEIDNFCKVNYGVTFPLFAKISVKGDDQHMLFKYLTSKATNPVAS